MGNDVDLWEVAQIYGKWHKYLTNGLNMCISEMDQVFEERLNYVGNDLDLFEISQICGKMT